MSEGGTFSTLLLEHFFEPFNSLYTTTLLTVRGLIFSTQQNDQEFRRSQHCIDYIASKTILLYEKRSRYGLQRLRSR